MSKTRTGKKLVSWLLTLVMVLGMLPAMTVTAGAAETRTTPLDLTTISESSTQGAAYAEGVYTNASEGWTWVEATNTLTLNGVNIDCSEETSEPYAVQLPADSTVNAINGNTIKGGATDRMSYGIFCNGNIEIKGVGSLTVIGNNVQSADKSVDSYGIGTKTGTITFSGSVQVAATSGTATSSGPVALLSELLLLLCNRQTQPRLT